MDSRGFSLLEMMLSLAIGTVVLGALFSSFFQVQVWSADIATLEDRDRGLSMLPVLLGNWISAAGNNGDGSWRPFALSGNTLLVNSDTDGARGFPDGRLDSPFESLAIRVGNGELQLRSGKGRFQSVERNVTRLEPDFEVPGLLRLRVTGETGQALRAGRRRVRRVLEIDYALPNLGPNLFEDGR